MSVWKRFQRVGKKASKFQFTASYTELVIETNNFNPSNVVITWMRRSRKYPSESIKLIEGKSKSSCYSHVWEVPRNEEIVTTLYRMKKELEYEEKDWTFQLEDVGDHGTRRRLLAYRNINMSQYADILPTQNNIKINFKISSKKIKSATLFLTLSAVFIKEGEATDDDMISVASLMSLPSSQNFPTIHNSDIARLSDLDDLSNDGSTTINDKFNELFDKIGSLDCHDYDMNSVATSDYDIKPVEAKERSPVKESSQKHNSPSMTIKTINNNKIDTDEDRLSNIAEEDRSPCTESNSTSDLLDWCKFITCGYKNVSITNFTTSFRNGIAFCAIIHHFHPDLIDFDSLTPSNVKENNRIAFTAAASLGIPKVLDPNEMSFLKVPDSLSIMTYLHQLRTHFTDCNLIITPASISNNSPHSYSKQVASNFTTTPIEPKEFDGFLPKTSNNTVPDTHTDIENNKTGLSSSSKQFVDDVKSSHSPPQTYEMNIIQNEDINHQELANKSDIKVVSKKKSPKKQQLKLSSLNIDGTLKTESSWVENKMKPVNVGKLNRFTDRDPQEIPNQKSKSPSRHSSTAASPKSAKKISVSTDNDVNENSYISAETAALEREQDKIDEEASRLEKQLRLVLDKGSNQESILMDKWFVLVNKKNALIRRNMQLQILEKEQNLEKKWSLLQEELRQINSIEDWNKTDEMKRQEDLLMKDLINIINQRDKVVRDLDNYEQSIAIDLEWAKHNPEMNPNNKFARTLAHAKFSDKNCVVQ